MEIPKNGKLLRIFIGESDQHNGQPLYEFIVHFAKKEGLAGCTVLRGIEGFGASSRIHTAKILRLSEDLPIVIEIVDAAEKVDTFCQKIEGLVKEGLATVENVQVLFYRHQRK